MIPKRAIFYWEGEPMSWLRRQSIATFTKLNPEWEVEILGSEDLPIEGDSRLARVLRSDWSRYIHLHEGGGVYFDTDIVFTRPIADRWLERDLLVCSGNGMAIDHIAMLGCAAGNEFIRTLADSCAITWKQLNPVPYQSMGVVLANQHKGVLADETYTQVPGQTICPIQWHEIELVWDEAGNPVPLATGLHWYGGDWLSSHMEGKANEEWLAGSKSMLADAIRQGRGL